MLKVVEAFAGIGAYSEALNNLNIEYDLVNYIEFDKTASKCYSLIHNVSEQKNLWDITKLSGKEIEEDIDLFCYSPPCQAFSKLGCTMKGTEDSRGVLFYDALRIIKEKKPKYLLMENVPTLMQTEKFKDTFNDMLSSLDSAGYNNYPMILNSSDYGSVQPRRRLFIISIRKDIKKEIKKPMEIERRKTLNDIFKLDTKKDMYYLSEYGLQEVLKRLGDKRGLIYNFWHDKILTDTLITIATRTDWTSRTSLVVLEDVDNKKLRHLTVEEAFEIMGFKKEYATKLFDNGIPKTQIHKRAGNSIVVETLEAIFKEMLL